MKPEWKSSVKKVLAITLTTIACYDLAFAEHIGVSSVVALRGKSSGGTITLMQCPWGSTRPYIAVTNDIGDSADIVVGRLSANLSGCQAIDHSSHLVREAKDGKLVLNSPRPWLLGGTDEGFSIPSAPISVSASSVATTDTVTVQWINPPGGYDAIYVVHSGAPVFQLPGDRTQYSYQREPSVGVPSVEESVLLIPEKGGTPSNGSGIRLTRFTQQESLMNVPFTRGLAPGFVRWTVDASDRLIVFEQGNLPTVFPCTKFQRFDGKGFYQIIKSKESFSGGVARRFLGLNSGHAYRIRARLNSLETRKGSWNFSLHAAYNPASGEELTAAQMSGTAALPNGSKGPTAGLIASLNPTSATEGKWVDCASDESTDVVIPASGVTSLTVWFHFQGKDMPGCAVGLDSVSIEDLGPKK